MRQDYKVHSPLLSFKMPLNCKYCLIYKHSEEPDKNFAATQCNFGGQFDTCSTYSASKNIFTSLVNFLIQLEMYGKITIYPVYSFKSQNGAYESISVHGLLTQGCLQITLFHLLP